MINKIFISISFLFLSFHYPLQAMIDTRNANYSDTSIDVNIPGNKYDLKVRRTYNSRSLMVGIFGFGMCSDFETSVEITPENTLLLTECGGGLKVSFSPKNFQSQKEIDKTVSKIMEEIKKKYPNKPEKTMSEMKSLLNDNVSKRIQYAQDLKVNSSVQEGTVYFANGSEVEKFIYSNDFYTRYLADGTLQKFNKKGQLVQLNDKNGNFLKIEFNTNNLPLSVTDSNGRKLQFQYNNNKKVVLISGPNNVSSSYKYKEENLVWVKNGWGNEFNIDYDDFHNITKISFPDKTFKSLTYNTKKDWVTSFTDRDGCLETYTYDSAPDAPQDHYWTIVKKVCQEKVVNNSKYEFWYKRRNDGQKYLDRVYTEYNQDKLDTTYHSITGKPLVVVKNGEKTNYDYYENGLVKSKISATSILTFKYDPQLNKVKEIQTQILSKTQKVSQTRLTQFNYDKKGNLSFAQNSQGQKIKITYDTKGRIETLTDQAKKVVTLTYDERFGKPSFVNRPGLGSIIVTYNADGTIKNVDSKEGPTVAVQVASTFNHLLDLIGPATGEFNL